LSHFWVVIRVILYKVLYWFTNKTISVYIQSVKKSVYIQNWFFMILIEFLQMSAQNIVIDRQKLYYLFSLGVWTLRVKIEEKELYTIVSLSLVSINTVVTYTYFPFSPPYTTFRLFILNIFHQPHSITQLQLCKQQIKSEIYKSKKDF
jgi:hypothetical protein